MVYNGSQEEHGKKYAGVHTAIVTPFHNGKIDYESFEKLIVKQVEASIASIAIFGTTGEGPSIPFHERREILHFARKYIPHEISLISGCGTANTEETIMQANIAEECGCTALQVVTPPYNKPTQEGLFRHFEAIHTRTNLDIILYNIPGRTCSSLEKETIQKLFNLDRVRGIKEATGSMATLMDVIEIARKYENKITVLSGDDILALPSIALGADGVMSVISNLLPNCTQKLIHAALEGNFESAKKLHYQMKPLIQSCFFETNPIPIKYMLSQIGLVKNEFRLPLVPISHETSLKIDAVMNAPGILSLLNEEKISAVATYATL